MDAYTCYSCNLNQWYIFRCIRSTNFPQETSGSYLYYKVVEAEHCWQADYCPYSNTKHSLSCIMCTYVEHSYTRYFKLNILYFAMYGINTKYFTFSSDTFKICCLFVVIAIHNNTNNAVVCNTLYTSSCICTRIKSPNGKNKQNNEKKMLYIFY